MCSGICDKMGGSQHFCEVEKNDHTSLAPLVSVIEIFNLTGPKIYKGNLIWTPWNFQIAVSRRRNKIF